MNRTNLFKIITVALLLLTPLSGQAAPWDTVDSCIKKHVAKAKSKVGASLLYKACRDFYEEKEINIPACDFPEDWDPDIPFASDIKDDGTPEAEDIIRDYNVICKSKGILGNKECYCKIMATYERVWQKQDNENSKKRAKCILQLREIKKAETDVAAGMIAKPCYKKY